MFKNVTHGAANSTAKMAGSLSYGLSKSCAEVSNGKKYTSNPPPYLMRQFCVLQWEEIKTKNPGAKHHLHVCVWREEVYEDLRLKIVKLYT